VSPGPFRTPTARAAVADGRLLRPDWTKSAQRDPRALWLDKNENTDPQLGRVTAKVLSEIDPKALFTYPESSGLYHKLAAHLGCRADQLLLTAGSDGVIRSVFEAFIDPGDAVVHTVPTFAMYAVYARMYGADPRTVAYAASEDGPRLSVETVVECIDRARPKLVCLPNPDSPTGTTFTPAAVRAVIEAAGDVGALILIDEAYHPFYEPTVMAMLDRFQHLVIARTFAKAWGLAGLRIGYAIGSREVIELLHKVRPMYEVNTLAVAVTERILDYSDEMRASVRRLNAGRDAFLARMECLGLRTFHARGNFLHVAFGVHAPAVHAALEGVVLYRRDFQEPCLRGFSRFSATTEEAFQPVIAAIERVITARQSLRGLA